MTDFTKLNEKISESDYPIGVIAKKIGITRQALHNKRYGKYEFSIGEMIALCKVLNLSNEEREKIFLGE